MDTKSPGPLRTFICSFPDCLASYNKAWKLDAHMCKHTGVKPFKCEHDGCEKSFCTKHHLARHELTHSGERPFKCTMDGCTEGFTTNTNMLRHISRIHNLEQKQYVCDSEGCGKVFKKNKQLKSHKCKEHTLEPPYPCTFEGCQKRFSFPNVLRRHEKVHRGYPCKEDGCSFMGQTWTEYTKHRRESHRVPVQCSECNKTFADAWFLQQHMRVHSDERQVYRCPRDGCVRSYTTLFNLQSHIRAFHEEQRPFTCPIAGCGKTFAMKQSLLRHSVAHDPERKKQKKPRPKRSLASRLSGYNPSKRSCPSQQQETTQTQSLTRNTEAPAPMELVCLLQDANVCNPVVRALEC